MKRVWELEELIDCFTIVPHEMKIVENNCVLQLRSLLSDARPAVKNRYHPRPFRPGDTLTAWPHDQDASAGRTIGGHGLPSRIQIIRE